MVNGELSRVLRRWPAAANSSLTIHHWFAYGRPGAAAHLAIAHPAAAPPPRSSPHPPLRSVGGPWQGNWSLSRWGCAAVWRMGCTWGCAGAALLSGGGAALLAALCASRWAGHWLHLAFTWASLCASRAPTLGLRSVLRAELGLGCAAVFAPAFAPGFALCLAHAAYGLCRWLAHLAALLSLRPPFAPTFALCFAPASARPGCPPRAARLHALSALVSLLASPPPSPLVLRPTSRLVPRTHCAWAAPDLRRCLRARLRVLSARASHPLRARLRSVLRAHLRAHLRAGLRSSWRLGFAHLRHLSAYPFAPTCAPPHR
jgi:hypothetical protein